MKIVGLITEYNPFHKGHSYHIEKAKELTGADAVVAVMSGDFVQRGYPAMVDKYGRCEAALAMGVDTVFELPTYFATSSAERFARGAVDILAGLGVDEIVYGCETDGNFKGLAELLHNEPDEYKALLKKYLSEGCSFPAARQKAVSLIDKECAALLEGPNNILGIEYEKAILASNYKVATHRIIRNDEGYYESGSKIRQLLSDGLDASDYVPSAMLDRIKYVSDIEDFASLIFYKLSELSKEELIEYYEMTEEIAARIKKYEKAADGEVEKLTLLASAKNITAAAVRRALIHTLLGIKKNESQEIYARILGLQKDSPVMQEIKKRAKIDIVTKFADAKKPAVKIDGHAAEVYNQVVKIKHGIIIPDEYHAGPIIF